jgi:hypothetical protein
MASPETEGNTIQTVNTQNHGSAENLPVRYDLGALLKENPSTYRVWLLRSATISNLGLSLRADVLYSFARETKGLQSVNIDCIHAVDYSIRPRDPRIIDGLPFIKYNEAHARLHADLQTVPHTDCENVFTPPIRFTLLSIDQSYVIAERFEMTVLYESLPKGIELTPIEEKRKSEERSRVMDSIRKFRLPP